MPRPFSGSGFFPPPPTTPEAYAALIAFFGGDQAAADAYLAQLEGYAADGDEAQDLLDAAEAAGDVATAITILEAGGSQTFAEKASALVDADCMAMVVPTPTATPYIEDLAGTFAGGDWNTALTILTGQPAGGYGARTGTSSAIGASGAVQIVGELSVHVALTDTTGAGVGAGYVASVSGVGETEAANYLWSLELGAAFYAYFAETGAGSNLTASWTRVQGAAISRSVLISITRSSTGRIRLYENGAALVCNATNVGTIGPAGAYVDLPLPTGGSSSNLWIASDPTAAPPDADVSLVAIYDVEQTASAVLGIAQALGYA